MHYVCMHVCTFVHMKPALSLYSIAFAELVSVVFHIHLATEESTLGDRPQCLPLPLPHPPPPPPPPPGFHAYL